MWYEILPSMAIITAALAIPGVINYYGHYFVLGNPYMRSKAERWDRMVFQRDMRLTGDPYKCNGLDAIPDEEPTREPTTEPATEPTPPC